MGARRATKQLDRLVSALCAVLLTLQLVFCFQSYKNMKCAGDRKFIEVGYACAENY